MHYKFLVLDYGRTKRGTQTDCHQRISLQFCIALLVTLLSAETKVGLKVCFKTSFLVPIDMQVRYGGSTYFLGAG